MGAHVIPREFQRRADAYVEMLVRRWIPAAAMAGLAESAMFSAIAAHSQSSKREEF